ncbi:hypothetical protein HMPREF7215_0819 [Pyramidobacter piscolens W5455]|uniref:Uncharacterized protein n=1 Tax=Pyramidobacter piscolens W5455 TaxID=352165 RepID=A0ABM9ZV45_9BACT|nr:hypothetical protein HMPREF7215_0819 [Pyramidobacter piscolens W5455]
MYTLVRGLLKAGLKMYNNAKGKIHFSEDSYLILWRGYG